MRIKTRLQGSWVPMAAALALLGCFSLTEAGATTPGANAVCSSTSSCSSQSPSVAFIDASVFSHGSDVCAQIRAAYGSLPSAGGVIDARGVIPGTNNSFSCANGTPWWDGGSTYYTTPAEILLPAGQIMMVEPWVLPNQTRVFGAGAFGYGFGTSLRACTIGSACLISSGGAMVQFGGTDTNSHTFCTACTGISVEYLTLNGGDNSETTQPQDFVAIQNEYAQNGSYVDQVTIENIAGSSAIGLQIGASGGASALNSGPYTNIFFNGSQNTFDGTTKCVEIYQSGTLGLHGITCTGGSVSFTTVAPAINLDASNTTIEDAHIEDFPEGIWVGHNQSVQSDTLANTSAGGASALTTIVHICGPNPPAGGTSCGNNTVSDVSLIGIANALGHNATNNIEDDLTNTLIPVMPGGSNTPIYGVGLYGVGDQFAGGYTRFSTSPDIRSSGTNPKPVPSWGVGDGPPGSGTCPVGSIFSNTGGTGSSNYTLYVCDQSGSSGVWHSVL